MNGLFLCPRRKQWGILKRLVRPSVPSVRPKSCLSGVLQKFEKVLPKFNHNPCYVTDETIERTCMEYVANNESDIGVLNLLPPIRKCFCCVPGKLVHQSSQNCTVFRLNSRAVTGVMNELRCTKCQTTSLIT